MKPVVIPSALATFWLLLSIQAEAKIASPCSACNAIAQELQTRLNNEPVRNHLDFRHRLDSQGQRYGKMVNYKISELRAVELLENLCKGMFGYTLVVVNATEDGQRKTRHWEQIKQLSSGAKRLEKSVEDAKQKQLEVFCGRVLEEHEEDLTAAIQKGVLEEEEGGVSRYLCGSLLKTCPPGRAETSTDSSSDDLESLPETVPGAASSGSSDFADGAVKRQGESTEL